MQDNDLTERLAATAAGTWGEEAAVWLLAEHSHWLPELERCGLIDEMPMAGGGTATVVRFGAINPERTPMVGTRSEWQVLRTAADLAGKPIDDWHAENLTSLDEDNRRLVLHAIAWGAGGRDWAKSLGLLRGLRCGTCQRSLTGVPGNEAIAHMQSHRAAAATVPTCVQCHQPFDPADTRFDGHAQHNETPFCRRCVDRCHESTDAFHACAVCAAPHEED